MSDLSKKIELIKKYNRKTCWIPVAQAHRAYVSFAIPGGSAIEKQLNFPAGISHFLEHLIYRQNMLSGYPLDNAGGKFGLETTREYLFIYAAFSNEQIRNIINLVESWWRHLNLSQEIITTESSIVIDEISYERQKISRILVEDLSRQLFPNSHLSVDFSGNREIISSLKKEQIVDFYQQILNIGYGVTAISDVSPWENCHEETLQTSDYLPWTPPRSMFNKNASVIQIVGKNISGSCTVVAGRVVAGRLSEDVIGSHAAHACLSFGKIHKGQIYFHDKLGLRFLYFYLYQYAEYGILFAKAECERSKLNVVKNILIDILDNPIEGSTFERIKKVTIHRLGTMIDNLQRSVVEESVNTLFGAKSLSTLLDTVYKISCLELKNYIDRAMLGSVSVIIY